MSRLELTQTLYHGAATKVETVDLHEGIKERDFGCGFYTTTSMTQAERFAKMKAKREAQGIGFVSEFVFVPNPSLHLNQKIFDRPNFEWLDFVSANRMPERFRKVSRIKYDMIVGPMAVDAVGVICNQYLEGAYGDPESLQARTMAIQLMEASDRQTQVFFGTIAAVSCLQYKGVSSIEIDG